jgi:hypothetical protein
VLCRNFSPEARTALRFTAEVGEEGRVSLVVPFPAGTRAVVFVVEEVDDPDADLLAAASSSTGFRDNPYDDADWDGA